MRHAAGGAVKTPDSRACRQECRHGRL